MIGKINRFNATFTVIMLLLAAYILNYLNEVAFTKYFMLKSGFKDLYIWQFLTYAFYSDKSMINFFFKALIIFYFVSVLENSWGTKKITIFILLAILVKSVLGFVIGLLFYKTNVAGFLIGSSSLYTVILIAYGFSFAEDIIYIFFILPIKIKYLAIISICFVLFSYYKVAVDTSLYPVDKLLFILVDISGYIPLLFFRGMIFRSNTKVIKQAAEKVNSAITAIIKNEKVKSNTDFVNKIKNNGNYTEGEIGGEDKVLCSDNDFDETDPYCLDCDGFRRCAVRRYKKH